MTARPTCAWDKAGYDSTILDKEEPARRRHTASTPHRRMKWSVREFDMCRPMARTVVRSTWPWSILPLEDIALLPDFAGWQPVRFKSGITILVGPPLLSAIPGVIPDRSASGV